MSTVVFRHCDEELEGKGDRCHEARLLRATFYILSKQQTKAMADLGILIEDDTVSGR